MKIQDSVALVTGANRGLGLTFAKALLAGGARKVYAAARDPASVKLAGVQPIQLETFIREMPAAAHHPMEVVGMIGIEGGEQLDDSVPGVASFDLEQVATEFAT